MSTTFLRTLGRSYLQQLANEHLRQWVMNLWLTTNDEEEAVFDLVPFAGAGREMADRHGEPGLGGELLQLHLPESDAIAIAPPTVCADQQLTCPGIELRSHPP